LKFQLPPLNTSLTLSSSKNQNGDISVPPGKWLLNRSVCYSYTVSCFEVKIERQAVEQDDKQRQYSCTLRDGRFRSKQYLTVHLKLHSAEKCFPCSQREKSFSHLYYLNRHMNLHSAKHRCSECRKCFQRTENLSVHMETHPGAKPTQSTSSDEPTTLRSMDCGGEPYRYLSQN